VHAVQRPSAHDTEFPVIPSWITPSYVKPTMSSWEAWIGPPTYPSSAHSPPARDSSFTRSSEALLRYLSRLTFRTRVQSDCCRTGSCVRAQTCSSQSTDAQDSVVLTQLYASVCQAGQDSCIPRRGTPWLVGSLRRHKGLPTGRGGVNRGSVAT
jgi:hypothetical protein